MHKLEAMRRPVIAPSNARDGSDLVAVLEPAARFSLRVGADHVIRRQSVAGFQLDLAINRCRRDGERLAARLGPDEWLLIGTGSETDALAVAIATQLEGAFFSLVDIGHRNAGFEIRGRHAADIVNGGCPLDLHDARFSPGSATRTLFGKAEIVLIRPNADHIYRIECWRSFAPYVWGLLQDVAREFVPDAPVQRRT